ncbi:hypothetical protein HGRIS_001192 [Hohenbuehelia grisea]|uniref:Uncharacterized protein n=1 Tax=Hohenbuehelia grisea TaxID=104357 RepID=A0ABR3JNR9_9AGAR
MDAESVSWQWLTSLRKISNSQANETPKIAQFFLSCMRVRFPFAIYHQSLLGFLLARSPFVPRPPRGLNTLHRSADSGSMFCTPQSPHRFKNVKRGGGSVRPSTDRPKRDYHTPPADHRHPVDCVHGNQ